MGIVIERVGQQYVASVSPPHGGGATWSSEAPLPKHELIERLRGLGCHTTDIGDAFYAADPAWLQRE